MDELVEQLAQLLQGEKVMLTTAESCTGGGIASACTNLAGSSHWYERGFVTYSNEAKMEMLGVKQSTLEHCGAVSEEVVSEMADGALAASHAQVAVAVSGIAGPDGGTIEKPVGTVCIGWAWQERGRRLTTFHFAGDRLQVRRQTIEAALRGIICW